MKILLVNTHDIMGGAARAAYRLHKGLLKDQIESQYLVAFKHSDDQDIIAPETKLAKFMTLSRQSIDQTPLYLYRKKKKELFSPAWCPTKTHLTINRLNPDIVHLHWIADGFMRIESLKKIRKPIVWTLHDMWAFTGGCHYDGECGGYQTQCGQCPQLKSNKTWDLSRWVHKRKQKAWCNLHFTLVTPSHWLKKCAKESSLFKNQRIEVIPHGIDTRIFKPIDKALARQTLNLPQEKKMILFGAMDPIKDTRKGGRLLQSALQELSKTQLKEKLEIILFGSSDIKGNITELNLSVHPLGYFHDDTSLALLYSAADLFIAPSIQDNLPNTVMESLSCGTPTVAFNIGGMPDMIEHKQNGYLAKPFETEDLANGIKWILENEQRYKELSQNAREKAEKEFSIELSAKRYINLYQKILENSA